MSQKSCPIFIVYSLYYDGHASGTFCIYHNRVRCDVKHALILQFDDKLYLLQGVLKYYEISVITVKTDVFI